MKTKKRKHVRFYWQNDSCFIKKNESRLFNIEICFYCAIE